MFWRNSMGNKNNEDINDREVSPKREDSLRGVVSQSESVRAEAPGPVDLSYGKAGFMGIFSNKYVFVCALFATVGGLLFGYDQGVISIILTMESFQEQFPEVAPGAKGAGFLKGLMTAMLNLGAFIGSANQGWIADKYSRKYSLFIAGIDFLIGGSIQTGSHSFATLIVGRFIGGAGVGMLAMVAPLYIGELAPPNIRGTLLVCQEFSITFGIVVAFYTTYATRHIPGEWSWRLPLLIQLLPAFILCASVFLLPFSPRWLCQKGREQEALRTLAKVRQLPIDDPRVVREWIEIRSEVQYRKVLAKENHPDLFDSPKRWNRIKLELQLYVDCWKRPTIKRTHVAVGLMFFQQFVGINALIYYAPTLFATMGLNYEMQLTMAGVLNVCQLIACIWSLWGLDRFGRRPLLFWGGIGMFICHFIIAVLVGKYSGDWENHKAEGWVSTAFLLIYMLVFGSSWGPIPWAMPAEIFPSSLRAKGVAWGTMSNWGNNFIIGLITPPMIEGIGFGTYVFFAAFCALATIWVYCVVPETNGATLEKMDQVFKDKSTAEERERRAQIEADFRNAESSGSDARV